MVLPDGERFVPLEQVIAAHLGELFPGMEIEQHHPFRVTRNADLTLEEEEADDLLAAVEIELRRRRFGRAVRLEIDAGMSDEVRELLQRELDLGDDDVYVTPARSTWAGCGRSTRSTGPTSRTTPTVPVTPPGWCDDDEPADVFARHPARRRAGPPPLRVLHAPRSRSWSGRRPPTRTCWPSR